MINDIDIWKAVQQLLIEQGLMDKKEFREGGFPIAAKEGWKHFCHKTNGFIFYAGKVPSGLTLPEDKIKKLIDMVGGIDIEQPEEVEEVEVEETIGTAEEPSAEATGEEVEEVEVEEVEGTVPAEEASEKVEVEEVEVEAVTLDNEIEEPSAEVENEQPVEEKKKYKKKK